MTERLPRSAAGRTNPLLIAALVSFGTMLEALDSTALSVALPTVAGSLSAGTEESDLILTTYLVANAAIMPISGWAATYFGRRPYYIACVILFTVSSLLCAMAWSVESLVVFRIFQGMAAAGNAASESSIIADSFPPEKRGQGFAIYGLAVVIGPTIGPVVGGWVAESYSWRWIFWINVPVGILAAFLSYTLLVDTPAVKQETKRVRGKGLGAIDWTGLVLAAGGLAALEIFFDEGQPQDWFASPTIVVAAVVAAIFLFTLPLWELTRKNPILDFRLFKNPAFAGAIAAMFVTGMALYASATLFPLMLQQQFGYSTLDAGLALAAGGLAVMLLMPISGSLAGKVRTRTLAGPGLIAVGVGLYVSSWIYPEWTFTQVSLARVGQAFGLAFLFVPLQSHAYKGAAANASEQIGAWLNLARNLGGSLGIALATTLLERGRQRHTDQLTDALVASDAVYSDYVARLEAVVGSTEAATAVLGNQVAQQASMLSYQDVYLVFAFLVAATLPVLLLLRGKAAPQVG